MATMFRLVITWLIVVQSVPISSVILRQEVKQLTERLNLLERTQVLNSGYHNTRIQQIVDMLSELNSTDTDEHGRLGLDDWEGGKGQKDMLDRILQTVTTVEKETNASVVKFEETTNQHLYAMHRGLQQEKLLRRRSLEQTEETLNEHSTALIDINERFDIRDAKTRSLIEQVNSTAIGARQAMEQEIVEKLVEINSTVINSGQQCAIDIGVRLDEVEEWKNELKSDLNEIKETLASINEFLKTLPTKEAIKDLKQVRCPPDWAWLEPTESCYKMFATLVTFDSAVGKCAAVNSHVTDVSSDTENDFMATLVGSEQTWIGLTDTAVEGVWRWRHDSAVATYTKWRSDPKQPDGGIGQNCVIMHWDRRPDKQLWNDWSCTTLNAFICKKRVE